MIGQVVDDERLQADSGAVAVMGASYGGAHAWLAAVTPDFTPSRVPSVTAVSAMRLDLPVRE